MPASASSTGVMPLAFLPLKARALAFGELATNSLKYGALKLGPAVSINGKADEEMLHRIWREQTDFGPAREGGQGLGLVERLVHASGRNI
jgi:two-component sensor histidine kinase